MINNCLHSFKFPNFKQKIIKQLSSIQVTAIFDRL